MRILIPLLVLASLFATSCVGAPDPKKVAEANEKALVAEGILALKPGDTAPAFTATSSTGERVEVGAVAAEVPSVSPGAEITSAEVQQPPSEEQSAADAQPPATATPADAEGVYTVLFFYPADFTPNSTKHLQELTKGLSQFAAANIRVYGVSEGSAEEHKDYAIKYEILVPLLADSGAIATAYSAVPPAGGKYPQRTLVGVKPDGTIGFYHRGFAHGKLVDMVLKESGRAPQKAAEPANTAK